MSVDLAIRLAPRPDDHLIEPPAPEPAGARPAQPRTGADALPGGVRDLVAHGKIGELRFGRTRVELYVWGALRSDPAYPQKR